MRGRLTRLLALTLVLALCIVLAPSFASAQVTDDGWVRIATDGLTDPANENAFATVEFKGKLYLGTQNFSGPTTTALVLAYDGHSFSQVAEPGFGDANNIGVYPLAVYQGELYAGTSNDAGSAQLWKTPDGDNWTRIGEDVFTNPDYTQMWPLGVQDGKLLLSYTGWSDYAQIWAYDGSELTRANVDGFGPYKAHSTSMGAVLDGRVHVLAWQRDGGGALVPLVYKAGTQWELSGEVGFGDPDNQGSYTVSSDGKTLVTAAENPNGIQVWRYDGTAWTRLADEGFGVATNTGGFAYTYMGNVYVGASDFLGGGGPSGPARVYRRKSDGSFEEWGAVGLGDETNDMLILYGNFRGDMFCGSYNETKGFQVFKARLPLGDTYYFAEGTTRDNETDGSFDTYLCIMNPGTDNVDVTVSYMTPGAGAGSEDAEYTVAAGSRFTINVADEIGKDRDVSFRVAADGPIVVERPMYFDYHGEWTGGHVITGVPCPEKKWYFAEGTTRCNDTDGSFDEWICVQNPGDSEAEVTFDYMLEDGTTQRVARTVAANSRHTEDVSADVGADRDVSVIVESDRPVVVERPMYFDYRGEWSGGHDTAGVTTTSTTYYFAEGCTYDWSDEWLCIQNPTDSEATVDITYQMVWDQSVTETVTVPATSRYTVDVAAAAGEGKDVSVYLESDTGIVAERPMYFNYHDKWPGGHDSMGLSRPRTWFYFAEGTTRSNPQDGYFEEWLCLQNPGEVPAEVEITFMLADGTEQVETVTVTRGSRVTVDVNELLGKGMDTSVYIESSEPIVAERPMYFLYRDLWPGGSDTVGTTYI